MCGGEHECQCLCLFSECECINWCWNLGSYCQVASGASWAVEQMVTSSDGVINHMELTSDLPGVWGCNLKLPSPQRIPVFQCFCDI